MARATLTNIGRLLAVAAASRRPEHRLDRFGPGWRPRVGMHESGCRLLAMMDSLVFEEPQLPDTAMRTTGSAAH